MKLTVQSPGEDKEVLMLQLNEELWDIEYNTLGKGFWTTEEWNDIVSRKFQLMATIKKLKRELSEEEV